jgi:tetratricopeptide (TPR) repeat protein
LLCLQSICKVYGLYVRVQVHITLAEAQSGLAEALADCPAPIRHAGFSTPDSATRTTQQPAMGRSTATATDGSWQGAAANSSTASTWQDAAAAALSACDAALNIDQTHVKAQLVKAEAHALYAQLFECSKKHTLEAKGAQSEHGMARLHWEAAVECYEKVLGEPQKLGSCSERISVRYNCACALAMVGRTQEATGLLQMIAQKNPEGLAGADKDVQLHNLWDLQEFRTLMLIR